MPVEGFGGEEAEKWLRRKNIKYLICVRTHKKNGRVGAAGRERRINIKLGNTKIRNAIYIFIRFYFVFFFTGMS